MQLQASKYIQIQLYKLSCHKAQLSPTLMHNFELQLYDFIFIYNIKLKYDFLFLKKKISLENFSYFGCPKC